MKIFIVKITRKLSKLRNKFKLNYYSELAKNVIKQVVETTVKLIIDTLLKVHLGRWLKELATNYQF